jgi:hypothetical protein
LRRVAGAGQVRRHDDVLRQRFERLRVPAPVLEVLLVHVESGNLLRKLAPGFLDRHEPMRFAVGQRPQQDAVHDREHGRRRADRDR